SLAIPRRRRSSPRENPRRNQPQRAAARRLPSSSHPWPVSLPLAASACLFQRPSWLVASIIDGLELEQNRNTCRAQQKGDLLNPPAEFGFICRAIAEIGAHPASKKRAVQHEHIVADRRRTGLRPGDDAACDGGAVDGADKNEVPGCGKIAEEVEGGGAAEQDAAVRDIIHAACMRLR